MKKLLLNKIKFFGIITAIAVIGLSMAACDGSSGGGDNPFAHLQTGTPSTEVLSNAGLSLAEFNTIRGATQGFQGWYWDEYYEDLTMVWSGRNAANFGNLLDVIEDTLGVTFTRNMGGALYHADAAGVGGAMFSPVGYPDFDIPPGVIIVGFWQ